MGARYPEGLLEDKIAAPPPRALFITSSDIACSCFLRAQAGSFLPAVLRICSKTTELRVLVWSKKHLAHGRLISK